MSGCSTSRHEGTGTVTARELHRTSKVDSRIQGGMKPRNADVQDETPAWYSLMGELPRNSVGAGTWAVHGTQPGDPACSQGCPPGPRLALAPR